MQLNDTYPKISSWLLHYLYATYLVSTIYSLYDFDSFYFLLFLSFTFLTLSKFIKYFRVYECKNWSNSDTSFSSFSYPLLHLERQSYTKVVQIIEEICRWGGIRCRITFFFIFVVLNNKPKRVRTGPSYALHDLLSGQQDV